MKIALLIVGGIVIIVLIAAYGASLPGSDERHI
jgi:hypothetical protein